MPLSKYGMTCNELLKNIKGFLEDSLSEEDYRGCLDHMDSCRPCQKSVRSLEAVSNHIWKLGEIKIRQGLEEAALLKMKDPDARVEAKNYMSPSIWLWFALLIIGLGVVGVTMTSLQPLSPEPAPLIETSAPFASQIAPVITEAERAVGVEGEEKRLEGLKLQETPKPAILEPLVPPAPAAELHLHVSYKDEDEFIRLKEKKKQLQNELEEWALRATRIKAHSEKKGLSPLVEDAETKKMISKLESDSNLFKSENLRVDNDLISAGNRQEVLEVRTRQKILDGVSAAKANIETQPSDMILFSAAGSALTEALQELYLLTREVADIEDFTKGSALEAEQKQLVSIYTERSRVPSSLHWHFRSEGEFKNNFIKMVEQEGGSIAYHRGSLAVCLIPRSGIGKLRTRLEAIRVRMTEFGSADSGADVLSTMPLAVSVFFREASS